MNTSACQGTNQAGGPCSATSQTGKHWCVWHDPDLVEQRKRWNQEAGRAKSNKRRARKRVLAAGLELPNVDSALCQALHDVLSGEIEPNIGTAAATIARAIVQVRDASEITARLDRLEAAARERGSA